MTVLAFPDIRPQVFPKQICDVTSLRAWLSGRWSILFSHPDDFAQEHIARCGPRFAMVLDPNLRCRRALSYRPAAELPSPLDLVGWAVALRKKNHIFRPSIEQHGPVGHRGCGA